MPYRSPLDNLSIQKLKQIALSRGIRIAHLLEKSEIVYTIESCINRQIQQEEDLLYAQEIAAGQRDHALPVGSSIQGQGVGHGWYPQDWTTEDVSNQGYLNDHVTQVTRRSFKNTGGGRSYTHKGKKIHFS